MGHSHQKCQGPLVNREQGVGSAGFLEAENGPCTNLRLRKRERQLSHLGRAPGTFRVSAPTSVPPALVRSLRCCHQSALFIRA